MNSKVAGTKAFGACTTVLVAVAVLLLGVANCKEESAIVLVIDTEMAVPDELDEVRISVMGPTSTEELDPLMLTAPSTPPFPWTLQLTPGTDQLSPVTIDIRGLLGGLESVGLIVQTGFVAGETRMLHSLLTAACPGVVCAADETCNLGVCAPRARAGGTLPPWSGSPPARPGLTGQPIGARSLWPGGWRHCATKGTTLYCWGENISGQLGIGTKGREEKTRRPVLALPPQVSSVGLGQQHSCVCEKSGQAWCWGRNANGQLGTDDLQERLQPVAVTGLTNCLQIAGGGAHTCAVTADARVACWGANGSGQTGQPTSTGNVLTPQFVPGLGSVTDVVTGEAFSCALTTNSIQCWGDNARGQLGDGTTVSHSMPARVTPQPVNPVQLVAGRVFACARLAASNRVSCWGENSAGLLGAARNPTPIPVEIPGIDDAKHLSGGHEHACVVRGSGVASCWGSGEFGQLGDGRKQNSAVPVDVVDIQGVTEVEAAYAHTCARHAAGISCWGQNTLGQLGDGTLSPNPRPVRVVGF